MEFPLRERVIVIVGPLSTTVQSIMSGLTADGADIALLDTHASKAEKFCAQLTDQREVKSKHGRAIAVTTDLGNFAKIQEAVGQVAQSFGGVDVLIDALICNDPTPLKLGSKDKNVDTAALDQLIAQNLKSSLLFTQAVAEFLKGRKKGRIIFLQNDSLLKGKPEDAMLIAVRSGLIGFAQSLAKQLQEHNITVNTLSLGLTEEYLLAHEPGILIKEALEKQKAQDPYARITEPDKITNTLTYLIGTSGAAITGQTIRLT